MKDEDDLERFLEILETPVPYGDISPASDATACEQLLEEFSDAEAEQLANTGSYAYWAVAKNPRWRSQLQQSGNARRLAALREIRRHYVGEGRNPTKSLAAIREALDYRQKYDLDAIRSCICANNNDENTSAAAAAASTTTTAVTYETLILEDLRRQPMVVRGVDDKGRSIIYKPPRGEPIASSSASETETDPDEGFLLAQIYTAERAMATNEFESKGREERLTVVFQFGGYSRRNTPASSTMIQMLKLLQRCYPERLGILVIANPPFWLRGVYNLAWPLMSTATTEKLKLPSPGAATEDEFRNLSSDLELRQGLASGSIAESVDLEEYVRAPFYKRFEPGQAGIANNKP